MRPNWEDRRVVFKRLFVRLRRFLAGRERQRTRRLRAQWKAREARLRHEILILQDVVRINETFVREDSLEANRVNRRLRAAFEQVAAAARRTGRGAEMAQEILIARQLACDPNYRGSQYYFPLGDNPPKNLFQADGAELRSGPIREPTPEMLD
ncbi:MAG: hypothetical protein KGJ93_04685 [Patescibacteria group bacterium]|nr:hypothetical protein [Patescibacteria group bacterium]